MYGFNDPRYSDEELSHMIYALGRTSDRLSVNEDAAHDYIIKNDDRRLFSRHDKDLLDDLYDAVKFLLGTDWTKTVFDYDYVRKINGKLVRTGSLKPGQDRPDGVPLIITTDYGDWTPGNVDKVAIERSIDKTLSEDRMSPVLRASFLFKTIAQQQPFGDGNQRTGLLAANALLMRLGDDGLFYPPILGSHEREMMRLMSDLYMKGSDAILWWLHDWTINIRVKRHPERRHELEMPVKVELGYL